MNYVTISQEEFEMRREHSIQCARDKAVLRDKVLVLEEDAERLRFELSVVWNAALDAAKKTTVRGLIAASDKEKAAHYTACKNISDAIDALKIGGSDAQKVNWARHQRPVSDEVQREIDLAVIRANT